MAGKPFEDVGGTSCTREDGVVGVGLVAQRHRGAVAVRVLQVGVDPRRRRDARRQMSRTPMSTGVVCPLSV